MQLQNFKRIKFKRGLKNCFFFPLFLKKKQKKLTFECSHWELLCKNRVLRYVFVKEFEMFWIVQSQGTQTKLGAL